MIRQSVRESWRILADEVGEAAPPSLGQVGRQRDRFLSDRVQERQGPSVQGDAAGERLLGAVLEVADDRMAAAGQLYAQLVRPPRLRSQLEPGQATIRGAAVIVDDRRLATRRVRSNDLDAPGVRVLTEP